jgi:HNH endonuclease
VSNWGNVRSLDRVVVTKDGRVCRYKGRLLAAGVNIATGYVGVNLCKNCVQETFVVHVLVLLAFVGPCPQGMEACHNDDVKTNNNLNNLAWKTHVDNIKDRVRNGHNAGILRGENSHCAKLTEDLVREARILRRDLGLSYAKIAKRIGNITAVTIHNVVMGGGWKHVK